MSYQSYVLELSDTLFILFVINMLDMNFLNFSLLHSLMMINYNSLSLFFVL